MMSQFTVGQPVFPVSPGSVLSQLLESTNPAYFRRPKFFGGIQDDGPSTGVLPLKKYTHNSTPETKPRSRIPTKRPQTQENTTAFEKSLRQYSSMIQKGTRSALSTPGTVSRASSPPQLKARSSSANKERPRSKIPSCKAPVHNNKSTRPPISPRIAPNSEYHRNESTPLNGKPYEPRPVRLAYSTRQRMPSPITNRFGWPNSHLSTSSYEEKGPQQNTNCSIADERRIRTLHTQAVVKVPRTPIQTCIPIKGDKGQIVCTCVHEEKACQTISTELLRNLKTKPASTENSVNEQSFRIDQDFKNEMDGNNDSQLTIEQLKKTLEELTLRNEFLELQLFESKEKVLEVESQKRLQSFNFIQKIAISTSTTNLTQQFNTTEVGINTEENLKEKLKFPLENFILSQFKDFSDGQIKEGDEEDNDLGKKLKMVQIALASREALLNELKVKLKKGNKILQKRCDALKIDSEIEQSSSGSSPVYKEIFPPEADYALHSYRRFVRFIHTYIEESLADIQEFDRMSSNLNDDSKKYFETKVEVNGVEMNGVFIPMSLSEKSSITEKADIELSEKMSQNFQIPLQIPEEIAPLALQLQSFSVYPLTLGTEDGDQQECDTKKETVGESRDNNDNDVVFIEDVTENGIVVVLPIINETIIKELFYNSMSSCVEESTPDLSHLYNSQNALSLPEVDEATGESFYTIQRFELNPEPFLPTSTRNGSCQLKSSLTDSLGSGHSESRMSVGKAISNTPIAAAKRWLERTSPINDFVLKPPSSFTKLFDSSIVSDNEDVLSLSSATNKHDSNKNVISSQESELNNASSKEKSQLQVAELTVLNIQDISEGTGNSKVSDSEEMQRKVEMEEITNELLKCIE